MKLSALSAAFVSLIFALIFSTASAQTPQPLVVSLAPEQIFVPPGFDSNDRVIVVFEGWYPNTCYRYGDSQVGIDFELRRILIRNLTFHYQGQICMEALVNYQGSATIGILPPGPWEIYFEDFNLRHIFYGTFEVSEATTADPDEQLYLPVNDFHVFQDLGPSPVLEIRGELPNSCMELSEIKILQRTPHVIEVLPVANIIRRSNCSPYPVPFVFRKPFKVDGFGRKLVHVRSLNGKALNQVIHFY